MLTEIEAKTIDALYDDAEAWWEYLWIASDGVQERSETAAEGLRWLCEIRQRPWRFLDYKSPWHWWVTDTPLSDCGHGDYLPSEFASVCRNGDAETDFGLRSRNDQTGFDTASGAVAAFLRRWCELTDGERASLWATYGKAVAA